MASSMRSNTDEDEPEVLVRKFVMQDRMHMSVSALTDFKEVENSDNLPHWISCDPDMRGRSLMLFWFM